MRQRQIKAGKFRFENCWVFPQPVEEFIYTMFNKFGIEEKDVCHVFSGQSMIGGKTYDIALQCSDVETKRQCPDVVADCLDLPDLLGVTLKITY